jgi:gas vesicle protein
MRKRSTNMAVGAVLLAGIGYMAGVLTAPKSGKETRKDIQRAALRAKSEAELRLKELNVELGDLIEQGKHKAKDVKESAKGEYVDMLGHAQFARQKARELLSALHEGDAEDKDLKRAINEVNKAIDHLKTYLKKK